MILMQLIAVLVSMSSVSLLDSFCAQNNFDYVNRDPVSNEFHFYRQLNASHTHHWILNMVSNSFVIYSHEVLTNNSYKLVLSVKNPIKNLSMSLSNEKSDLEWYWTEKGINTKREAIAGKWIFVGIFWLQTYNDIHVVGDNLTLPMDQRFQSVYSISGINKQLSLEKSVNKFFGCPHIQKKSNFWLWVAMFASIIFVIITAIIVVVIVYAKFRRRLSVRTESSYGPEFPSKTVDDNSGKPKTSTDSDSDPKNLKTDKKLKKYGKSVALKKVH